VNFASAVEQVKYQSVCESSSIQIVAPDWIIHCVDAMSHIDETRYHPRLLLTVSEEVVHQHSSPMSYLSQCNRQLNITEASSVVVSETFVHARPCVVTAVEKSLSAVPVFVIPTTPVSQQYVQTHLKSIGNGNEYLNEVCQSLLKPAKPTKVCISQC